MESEPSFPLERVVFADSPIGRKRSVVRQIVFQLPKQLTGVNPGGSAGKDEFDYDQADKPSSARNWCFGLRC